MLNCVYSPTDDMRVVEDEEKEKLIASGPWFDHPLKAKAAREKAEANIKKKAKSKAKSEGMNDERIE